MPIFEYDCPNCGKFEMIRNASDKEVKFCPECGEKVEKLISAPGGFEFKGKGFYQTDYKKNMMSVSEKNTSGNNVVKIPKVDLFEQFDQRRAEERRKVKKEKDRIWRNKI